MHSSMDGSQEQHAEQTAPGTEEDVPSDSDSVCCQSPNGRCLPCRGRSQSWGFLGPGWGRGSFSGQLYLLNGF